jgi:hypothetical protein
MASVLDVVGMENDALLSAVERLVKADRSLGATLLVHLGEVDARKLYLARGYSSMFVYCRSALGMSEAEAYLRMRAADVGRKFPLVLERFGSGGVHLSAIKLLAPHLTQDNHAQLLDRVRGMTKREIEVLVAELAPKPDVPARMRKLPKRAVKPAAAFDFATARAATIAVPPPAAASTTAVPASATASAPEDAPLASPALPAAELADRAFALQPLAARAATTPLSPGRFKLELTLGQDAHDQLLQLQALFRHQNPSGDLASIVERALRELLERTMQRRFAQTRASAKHLARSHDVRESGGDAQEQHDALGDAREEYGPILSADETAPSDTPREARDEDEPAEAEVAVAAEPPASLPNSRYVPRKVLREVFARDGGQCAFVSSEGRRCSAREFLEVHHHEPFARGGKATVDNLRLSCRAHNQFLAELDYGRGFMREKIREAERASCHSAARS